LKKAQTSIRCKPIRSISATHNGWESTNLNPAQTDSPNLSDTVGGKAQTSIRSKPTRLISATQWVPHPSRFLRWVGKHKPQSGPNQSRTRISLYRQQVELSGNLQRGAWWLILARIDRQRRLRHVAHLKCTLVM